MKAQSPRNIVTLILTIIIAAIFVSGCTKSLQNNDEINSENIIDVKSEELLINGEFVGYVKVILEEKGYEHVHTPLTIQWLNKDSIMTNEVTLNNYNPDVWALSINSLEKTPNGLLLELSGIHSYSHENRDFSLNINKNEVTGDLK